MLLRNANSISTVGIVGCGLIGIGWTSIFLSKGYRVIATDIDGDAEQRIKSEVEKTWQDLVRLGISDDASPDKLEFNASLKDTCNSVDFIQENSPDVVDLKQSLLETIDRFAPPDIIISSSTSGIEKQVLDNRCRHKDRVIVGHPFHPVHLMPLVEIVASEAAAPIAESFYEGVGKSVVVLEKDVPGFIANRFQEAIWREALHMVSAGEATPAQIDRAIVNGPGLRWPILGPFMARELGCGYGGIDALIAEEYDDPMPESWSRTPLPKMTPDLEKAMREGSEVLCAGKSYSERVTERDKKIMAILEARRGPDKNPT
ncbi:MAG: 3-hydroxyacyl-CoA dehydrogenase NAD-binding domain-containing protein [Pseudomonadota bacterium]